MLASYYTIESCKAEGTSGITASGEPLRDDVLTCASNDYRLNTILLVRYAPAGTEVRVRVNDKGPGKKARRKGIRLDLTQTAFNTLAPLSKGVILVEVNPIRKEE